MGKYANLKFFDGNSDELNLVYDETNEIWGGIVYLPEVSVGLYETLSIYMFEEVKGSLNETKYITPITQESSGSTKLILNFTDEYDSSKDISLYSTSLVDGEFYVKHEDKQITSLLPTYHIAGNVDGINTVSSDIKNSPIQINIALNSEDEQYHTRVLRIFEADSNGITTHEIANIKVYGETVGEDERLQDLLTNIGMSIKPTDYLIFEDSDLKENGVDWKLINRKRRELLLEASNIKPFIGTYKAILNAIKYFGYENLTLKEYWLNINEQAERFGKLKAVAVPNQDVKGFLASKGKGSEFPNSNLKKTSKFSLVYRLNNFTGEFDYWDLPKVKEVTDFTPDEVLVKLYGLKKKLHKEFLPMQSKIVDIVGEADYFSQFNINTWNNQQNIQTQNAGIDLMFDMVPNNGGIYIEDLRKVDGVLTGLGQDFELLSGSSINNSIKSFYDNYNDISMSTFNDFDGGPIGAPIILKGTDSLPKSWDSALFSFNDAEDSYNSIGGSISNLMTWNNWWTRNVYEVEWRLIGPNNYDRTFRGPTDDFLEFALTLPYSGKYSIEMALYDLYNVRSVLFMKDEIEVLQKNIEIYGMYRSLNEEPEWDLAKYNWNVSGGIWDLAGENDTKIEDSLATYYLTLDRANYIHDNSNGWEFSTTEMFGDPSGYEYTSGPYSWSNLNKLNWLDGLTTSWDMTNIFHDENSTFTILSTSTSIGSVNTISITRDSVTETYNIASVLPNGNGDLAAWYNLANELNSINELTYPIISSFNYNPMFTDNNNTGSYTECINIKAVSKLATSSYDFDSVSVYSSTGNGFSIDISKTTHFKSNNPKYNDAKIIASHDTVNKFNHLTFSFDNSKAPGIVEHEWTIENNTKSIDDIYYSNKWLTYVFTSTGDYTISLKTKDVNGNINTTNKNILTII